MYYYLDNEDYRAVGMDEAGSGFYFAGKLVAWLNIFEYSWQFGKPYEE